MQLQVSWPPGIVCLMEPGKEQISPLVLILLLFHNVVDLNASKTLPELYNLVDLSYP